MEKDRSKQAALLDAALKQTAKEEDGNLLVQTYQDVGPHLEYAAKCRRVDAEDRGAFGKRGDIRRTMSVGMGVILEVAQKLGIPLGNIFDTEHSKRIWRELKTREYAGFRTTIDKNI